MEPQLAQFCEEGLPLTLRVEYRNLPGAPCHWSPPLEQADQAAEDELQKRHENGIPLATRSQPAKEECFLAKNYKTQQILTPIDHRFGDINMKVKDRAIKAWMKVVKMCKENAVTDDLKSPVVSVVAGDPEKTPEDSGKASSTLQGFKAASASHLEITGKPPKRHQLPSRMRTWKDFKDNHTNEPICTMPKSSSDERPLCKRRTLRLVPPTATPKASSSDERPLTRVLKNPGELVALQNLKRRNETEKRKRSSSSDEGDDSDEDGNGSDDGIQRTWPHGTLTDDPTIPMPWRWYGYDAVVHYGSFVGEPPRKRFHILDPAAQGAAPGLFNKHLPKVAYGKCRFYQWAKKQVMNDPEVVLEIEPPDMSGRRAWCFYRMAAKMDDGDSDDEKPLTSLKRESQCVQVKTGDVRGERGRITTSPVTCCHKVPNHGTLATEEID